MPIFAHCAVPVLPENTKQSGGRSEQKRRRRRDREPFFQKRNPFRKPQVFAQQRSLFRYIIKKEEEKANPFYKVYSLPMVKCVREGN